MSEGLVFLENVGAFYETAWRRMFVDQNKRITFAKFLGEANQDLIAAHGAPYWVAAFNDDPRNPEWRPFQIMETFCRKKRCDFEAVKSMLEDRLYKRLQCECEILTNRNDIKRRELEAFGLDVGGAGRREFGIL